MPLTKFYSFTISVCELRVLFTELIKSMHVNHHFKKNFHLIFDIRMFFKFQVFMVSMLCGNESQIITSRSNNLYLIKSKV